VDRSSVFETERLWLLVALGALACGTAKADLPPKAPPQASPSPVKETCDGLGAMEWWDCCIRERGSGGLACATKIIPSQLRFSCEKAAAQSCIPPEVWDCGTLGVVHVTPTGLFEFERSAEAWYRGCMTCDGRVEGLSYFQDINNVAHFRFEVAPDRTRAAATWGWCTDKPTRDCLATPTNGPGSVLCKRVIDRHG
jgi:hypothetical protein